MGFCWYFGGQNSCQAGFEKLDVEEEEEKVDEEEDDWKKWRRRRRRWVAKVEEEEEDIPPHSFGVGARGTQLARDNHTFSLYILCRSF